MVQSDWPQSCGGPASPQLSRPAAREDLQAVDADRSSPVSHQADPVASLGSEVASEWVSGCRWASVRPNC